MATILAGAISPRRRRRTRVDVDASIRAAARQLFANLGYAATTTREIAQVADVSETLVFRYYGDKAQLFDAVIHEPFNQVMREFTAVQQATGASGTHDLSVLVYDLLTENRDLLSALIFGRPPPETAAGRKGPEFEPFFMAATAQLTKEYELRGSASDFDFDTAIRLAFGMMVGSVLMSDWLFPLGGSREHLIEVIEMMVGRALRTGRYVT